MSWKDQDAQSEQKIMHLTHRAPVGADNAQFSTQIFSDAKPQKTLGKE